MIPLPRAMGGPPDIPDAHIPDAVVELPNVAHIHPAPIVADLDLVMGPDFNALTALRKGVDGAGIDHPFADTFTPVRPHRDGHWILPVIDDFQEPTGFIAVGFRMRGAGLIGKGRPPWRQLDLNLCKSKQRGEGQDKGYQADPANLSTCHTASILF